MDFIPITPAEYQRMKPFFAGQNYPLSPYSLSSIIVWNRCIYSNYYAIEEDVLFVAEVGAGEPEEKYLLLPVSGTREFSPARLWIKAVENGYGEYRFVPETYLKRYGLGEIEKCFRVREQPGYEDYIYLSSDLAELKGKKYSPKRNLVSQFRRDYLDKGRVEIHELTPDNSEQCLVFMGEWRLERGERSWTQDLECEKLALVQALAALREIEAEGIIVTIDGRVSAFALGSRLKDDTWVLNFEKASDRIKGLYQFLDREYSKRVAAMGFTYISKESDMQDQGLARAKQSYHPVMRVRSYRLEVIPVKPKSSPMKNSEIPGFK